MSGFKNKTFKAKFDEIKSEPDHIFANRMLTYIVKCLKISRKDIETSLDLLYSDMYDE